MKPRDCVDVLARRLGWLESRVEAIPQDTGNGWQKAEIAALRWALPILRAEAAADQADQPQRERLRRVFGAARVPQAVEPYVGEPGRERQP